MKLRSAIKFSKREMHFTVPTKALASKNMFPSAREVTSFLKRYFVMKTHSGRIPHFPRKNIIQKEWKQFHFPSKTSSSSSKKMDGLSMYFLWFNCLILPSAVSCRLSTHAPARLALLQPGRGGALGGDGRGDRVAPWSEAANKWQGGNIQVKKADLIENR